MDQIEWGLDSVKLYAPGAPSRKYPVPMSLLYQKGPMASKSSKQASVGRMAAVQADRIRVSTLSTFHLVTMFNVIVTACLRSRFDKTMTQFLHATAT